MTKSATTTNFESEVQGENTRGSFFFTPRVDIYETEQELMLFADVPGVKANDVDMRFERGELILQGRIKSQSKPGQAVSKEYEEGDFYRVFQIHESIDGARIAAECKNGVLTVHLPKVEAVKPRQVKVRGD
jgi:HSP20 family protein